MKPKFYGRLTLLGGVFLYWAIHTCITGRIYASKGGSYITPETDPLLFWAIAIGSALVGLACIAPTLISFVPAKRREKSSPRSSGTSDHSNANDSASQSLTHRVYRERNRGRNVFGAFFLLLVSATFVIAGIVREESLWVWIIFACFLGALAIWSLVWRDVTVDAAAGVVSEAWRFFGRLTVWKRQRGLGEFAAVRSQRVEVVAKGDRRVYCDVYFVAAAGAGKRLDVERFEMGQEGGSPEGVAVGLDLARLTGLPFEDKC